MAGVIERRFFVTGDGWRTGSGVRMLQGYLNKDMDRTVRVRIEGDRAFLTVKGRKDSALSEGFNYEIPVPDAKKMVVLCEGPVVVKMRHQIEHNGVQWKVDEFLGENAGLVVAEVEVESEDQLIDKPSWIAQEVTDDPRFYNANLSTTEFRSWYDDTNTNV